MQTVWVNRGGVVWPDALPAADACVTDLDGLVGAAHVETVNGAPAPDVVSSVRRRLPVGRRLDA